MNKDYVWRVLASDKDRTPVIDKYFETRFGIIWFLLTYWRRYPSRFTIYRMRKPCLVTPRRSKQIEEDVAHNGLVIRLAQLTHEETKDGN